MTNTEAIRQYAKAILAQLPPEETGSEVGSVLSKIKELLPSVSLGPWFLSEPEESDMGYEFQTLAALPPPHYEEMVAQFFPGNHGTEPAELILLLLNNLEAIIAAAEKGITP